MRLIDADAIPEISWDPLEERAFRKIIEEAPTIAAEPVHYCRECKWSWCHVDVDKHGKIETYWRCLNWDGETDEEGYCHEWETKMEDAE